MSKENMEVLRDQYAATNERDWSRALAYYAEDVVMTIPEGSYLIAGTYAGREAVGEWFGDWFRTFARDLRFEITELTELGDGSILLVADHLGRGRASGVEIHGNAVWVFRFRDGKITHLYGYRSRDEALADNREPDDR
jgi:ketosteroid isomerase-like protein